ncbi:MAG: polysaccharide pyruvyl transferase family protein [Amaricoccus sp.]
MTPRRIGVLTFHRCINYGSYWQARCLVEGLRRRGHDAVLLDHRSQQVDRAEWRCALTPHRPAPTRASDRAAYGRKTRRFLSAIADLPLSRPFNLERPEAMDPCDVVLVGSDEVWNLRHPWYGGARLFYGAGVPAPRLAAYAASFGNHPAADGLDDALRALLGRFDAISVRDENSRRLVGQSLGHEPELVLDPCLQFPEVATRHVPAARFVVVYGHSFPEWFQAGIRAWAKRRSLPLVSLGYHNDWADAQWPDAGPEDFPLCIGAAAAVATTFFHGCVFALLNGRPFACAASDYRANKVSSLVSTLGARRRLLADDASAADYRAALETEPEPDVIARLADLRERSNVFLDDVLQ